MSTYFYDLVNSKDPAVIARADKEISKDLLLHAIMRNTIAPVLLIIVDTLAMAAKLL